MSSCPPTQPPVSSLLLSSILFLSHTCKTEGQREKNGEWIGRFLATQCTQLPSLMKKSSKVWAELAGLECDHQGSIKIIPEAFSLLFSSPFSSFCLSLLYWLCTSQMVINYVFSPFNYFHQLIFFAVHALSVFAMLDGPDLTYFQCSCALLFLFFPLFLFVNLQRRRMREQIMKHRSAFHTLFRRNSPTAQRGRAGGMQFYPYFQPITSTVFGGVLDIGSYWTETWLFRLLCWTDSPTLLTSFFFT